MQGATATIVGVFDTTTYAISYTPVIGGERVTTLRRLVGKKLQTINGLQKVNYRLLIDFDASSPYRLGSHIKKANGSEWIH